MLRRLKMMFPANYIFLVIAKVRDYLTIVMMILAIGYIGVYKFAGYTLDNDSWWWLTWYLLMIPLQLTINVPLDRYLSKKRLLARTLWAVLVCILNCMVYLTQLYIILNLNMMKG